MFNRAFPESAASIRSARNFVATHLQGADHDSRWAAVAAVSEVATNSVRHAHSDFTVKLTYDVEQIRIDVTDTGPGMPVRRTPAASDIGGRGLNILDALSDQWGVVKSPGSKTVWFTIRPRAQMAHGLNGPV